jgi:hypothetical protein
VVCFTFSWMLVLSLLSISWKLWFHGSRVAQRCTSLKAWSNFPKCSSAWHRRYRALMSLESMSMAREGRTDRSAGRQVPGCRLPLPTPLPQLQELCLHVYLRDHPLHNSLAHTIPLPMAHTVGACILPWTGISLLLQAARQPGSSSTKTLLFLPKIHSL